MKLSRALPFLPLLPLLPLAVALNGCINVGPNYSLPQQALVNAPLANAPLDGADTALTTRQNVPPVLVASLRRSGARTDLVDEALQSNTDLRVAAANLGALA